MNSIAPGCVRSNANTERQWEAMGSQRQHALLKCIALKRLGSAQDIANGVLLFAAEKTGWVSGHGRRRQIAPEFQSLTASGASPSASRSRSTRALRFCARYTSATGPGAIIGLTRTRFI